MQAHLEALTAESNGAGAQDAKADSGSFIWRGQTFQVQSGTSQPGPLGALLPNSEPPDKMLTSEREGFLVQE